MKKKNENIFLCKKRIIKQRMSCDFIFHYKKLNCQVSEIKIYLSVYFS